MDTNAVGRTGEYFVRIESCITYFDLGHPFPAVFDGFATTESQSSFSAPLERLNLFLFTTTDSLLQPQNKIYSLAGVDIASTTTTAPTRTVGL